jgi:uncharacterized protein (DUF4415 family)
MKEKNFTVVSRGTTRQGKTDWKRIRTLTDAEIDAAIANDSDWDEFKDVDWSTAEVILPPKKKAISIRVDEDVLKFFKHGGEGYQRRINAVLRSFMRAKRSKKRA